MSKSKLRSIDVSDKTEKKGKFTYLSWSWAVDRLIEHHPDATWEVKRFPLIFVKEGVVTAIPEMLVPFMKTNMGNFVEVEVKVNGVERTQIHPILNHQNKPIESPNAFDVNTAIQRCLAKAIALHGLGLYIYAGEDLPPTDEYRGNGQMNPEPIDEERVNASASDLKAWIDVDEIELYHNRIKGKWATLSNDERMAVVDQMKEKAPDSNKAYKNLLKEYLNYSEAEQEKV